MHSLQLPNLEPVQGLFTQQRLSMKIIPHFKLGDFLHNKLQVSPNIFFFCLRVIFKAQTVKVLGNKTFAACFIRTMLSSDNGH